MKILISVILILFVIFLISLLTFLISKIRISIEYSKAKGQKFTYNISLSMFWGIINKRIHPSKKNKSLKKKHRDKTSSNDKTSENEELSFFKKIKKYYGEFLIWKNVYKKNSCKIRKTVHIEKTNLELKFGLGDAAITGITTGSVWAGIYNVIAFFARIFRVTEPKIEITPLYNELSCELRGECIITTRVANLIGVVVSIGMSYYFNKKRLNKKEKAANNHVNTD